LTLGKEREMKKCPVKGMTIEKCQQFLICQYLISGTNIETAMQIMIFFFTKVTGIKNILLFF
jgi:hypothetical protein